jgi:Gpi18-like mannosyltransferase
MRRQWYRNKSIILKILVLFLVSRILLTAVGLGSTIYSSHNFNYTGGSFWKYSESKILDIWGIWDTGYYLDIAKRGYSTNLNFEFPVKPPNNPAFAEHETNYAFFPLYSMLIKAVTFATKDYFVSGLLISNTLLLFSAFFLYKLTKVLFDSQTAKKSVYFLFLFPTSFVLSGVFTESTILFCLVLSCYLMERKKWLLSGVVAAFASLTKITGILVTSIFLIRYGIKPINKQRILSIILPFVTINTPNLAIS